MKPKRIQLSRKKGWRLPANTVIVARPGNYGNPIRVGDLVKLEIDGSMYDTKATPAIAVELHREYIKGALKRCPKLLESLRGKNLACWCRIGDPCHADTLLEIANR